MLEIICDVLLPGKKPEIHPGKGGHDQLIDHSPLLPDGRTFKEAVQDIACGGQGPHGMGVSFVISHLLFVICVVVQQPRPAAGRAAWDGG